MCLGQVCQHWHRGEERKSRKRKSKEVGRESGQEEHYGREQTCTSSLTQGTLCHKPSSLHPPPPPLDHDRDQEMLLPTEEEQIPDLSSFLPRRAMIHCSLAISPTSRLYAWLLCLCSLPGPLRPTSSLACRFMLISEIILSCVRFTLWVTCWLPAACL